MDATPEQDTLAPATDDSVCRPTHRLDAVKVGDHGVQLLVSTKDHLYDASNIEAGEHAWQVIGAWDDAAVQQLGKMLEQRQTIPSQQTSGASRFGTAYGAGKTFRSAKNTTGGDN